MGLIGFNGNQDEVEEKQTQRHPIISSFAEGTDKRKLTPVEEMLFLKENRRIDEEFSKWLNISKDAEDHMQSLLRQKKMVEERNVDWLLGVIVGK